MSDYETNLMYVFFKRFDEITEQIPFNEKWMNGTGYLDFAVKGPHAPSLAPGQIVKCIDNGGRKIIIIGTRFGSVVVFQRFTDRQDVVVYNTADKLCSTGLLKGNVMTEDKLSWVLGYHDFDPNIGIIIENLRKD